MSVRVMDRQLAADRSPSSSAPAGGRLTLYSRRSCAGIPLEGRMIQVLLKVCARVCVCVHARAHVCVWITHSVHYSCEEELIFYLTLQISLFICVTLTLGGIDLCLRHVLPLILSICVIDPQ